MNKNIKPGPKTKDSYLCICCDPPRSFTTSKKKGDHQRNQRIKKSKTEVGDKDTNLEDIFGTPVKTSNEKILTLKDTIGAQNKFNQFQSAFKRVALKDKILVSTSIGPNSTLNTDDILMEKDSSEEKRECQGQGSSSNSQTSNEYQPESLEDLARQLDMSQGWIDAKEMIKLGALERTQQIIGSKDFYMSVLIQGCALLKQLPQKFPQALAIAYGWLDRKGIKIPKIIQDSYVEFFTRYRGHKPLRGQEKRFHVEELRTLFKFCLQLHASVEWIKYLSEPDLLVGEKAILTGCSTAARLLFECKRHYSHEYFKLIDYIMDQSNLTLPNVNGFVQFIKFEAVFINNKWKDIFQRYARTENTYGRSKTIKIGSQILGVITKQINCSLLMDIIEKALQINRCEEIKAVLRLQEFQTMEQFQSELDFYLEKSTIKEEEIKRQKIIKEKQEKEKRIAAEQEQLKLKQFEEEGKRQELEEEIRQTNILSTYHSYCQHNNMISDDVKFLEFVEQIQNISAGLPTPIAPRPIQLAILFGLATSQHITTLMQLPTGWGKSYMFGMLARYLNLILGKKVAVVVPNETLAAIQQDLFSPWANRAQIDLTKVEAITISYCTYDDFLSGNIPANTLCLVDELDSLFFSDSPLIKGDRFLSAIILLNKYQIVGMSATFRGHQGTDFILRFLHGSIVQSAGDAVTERKLQLDVYGKLNAAEIKGKVMELVKIKQAEIPVVIILPSITICEEYESLMENCWIFGRGNVPEQLSCLRQLKKFTASPWPVVLTTSIACLGHDLTATAFVIQTELPSSWAVFLQNMGRGNRVDPNAVLYGALVTQSAVFDQESIQQGCEYQQQRANLFRYDYFDCLQYLECCSLVDSSLLTFKQAFKLFQKGTTARELYKLLSKVHKFKIALEVSGLAMQPTNVSIDKFKVPIPVSKTEALGKRRTTGKANTLDNFLQSPTTKRKTVGDDEYSSSEEGKWFEAENKANQEVVHDDEVVMHHDGLEIHQSASELNEAVLEEKEKQMALELMVKYNLGGQQFLELRQEFAQGVGVGQKKTGTASPQSKTSSEILGLDNASESLVGIRIKKKREQKNWEKESVKSGESQHSKVSRSTNGRYEGGTTFNNKLFVKAGISNGGKQQWKCASCQKKTVTPINHLCA